jgi:hypothetical protein
MEGQFCSGIDVITLEDIVFLKFSCTQHVIKPLEVELFDAPSHYDIIIGCALLSLFSIKIDFDTDVSTLEHSTIAMRDRDTFPTQYSAMILYIELCNDNDAKELHAPNNT